MKVGSAAFFINNKSVDRLVGWHLFYKYFYNVVEIRKMKLDKVKL